MFLKPTRNEQHGNKPDILSRLTKLQTISHELVMVSGSRQSTGNGKWFYLWISIKEVRIILVPNSRHSLMKFQKHWQSLMDRLCPKLLTLSCGSRYLFWQGCSAQCVTDDL